MPKTVKNAVRAGAVAVVVGLVGYAVWVASRPDASSTAGQGASNESKRDKKGADDPGEGKGANGRPTKARTTGSGSGTPPTRAAMTPPPGPTPAEDIDYEKTLDALEAFVADVESLHQRGIKVPQPEWVERYRKGSELVDALMRAPESKDPRARTEVQDLNMRFRKVIQDLLATP